MSDSVLDSELKANTVHIPHLPHVVASLTVAGTIFHVVYMNICQKTLQVRTAPRICLHLGCTDVLRERGHSNSEKGVRLGADAAQLPDRLHYREMAELCSVTFNRQRRRRDGDRALVREKIVVGDG